MYVYITNFTLLNRSNPLSQPPPHPILHHTSPSNNLVQLHGTNLMENHVKKQIEDQHGNVYFNILCYEFDGKSCQETNRGSTW